MKFDSEVVLFGMSLGLWPAESWLLSPIIVRGSSKLSKKDEDISKWSILALSTVCGAILVYLFATTPAGRDHDLWYWTTIMAICYPPSLITSAVAQVLALKISGSPEARPMAVHITLQTTKCRLGASICCALLFGSFAFFYS
jgi:biotin transporter BioY